jgi:hypothetical protein
MPQNGMAKRYVKISSLRYHYAIRRMWVISNIPCDMGSQNRKHTSVVRATPPRHSYFLNVEHVFDYYWVFRAIENGSNVNRFSQIAARLLDKLALRRYKR